MIRLPNFSDFIQLLESKESKAKELLDKEYSFFFICDGQIYGAPEESRLTFARLKNLEDDDKSWAEDANFSADDLTKAMKDEQSQRLFTMKDLDKLKIITQEMAQKKLSK